ncbi:hypothetical protein LINGRAHAP2_LOCUS14317 [Linum grandiflorum]
MASSSSSSGANRHYGDDPILNLTPTKVHGAVGAYNLLMGKFLCQRKVNMGMVKGGIRRAWPEVKGVNVDEAKDNKFLFTFKLRADMEEIWERRPWLISDTTMIVQKWDGLGQPEEVQFPTGDFWVRVHNLPATHRNWDNMVKIASLFPRTITISRAGLDGDRWTRIGHQFHGCTWRIAEEQDFEERLQIKGKRVDLGGNSDGALTGDGDGGSSPPGFSRRLSRETLRRENERSATPAIPTAPAYDEAHSPITPSLSLAGLAEMQSFTPSTADFFPGLTKEMRFESLQPRNLAASMGDLSVTPPPPQARETSGPGWVAEAHHAFLQQVLSYGLILGSDNDGLPQLPAGKNHNIGPTLQNYQAAPKKTKPSLTVTNYAEGCVNPPAKNIGLSKSARTINSRNKKRAATSKSESHIAEEAGREESAEDEVLPSGGEDGGSVAYPEPPHLP